jgi:hypothetical protein
MLCSPSAATGSVVGHWQPITRHITRKPLSRQAFLVGAAWASIER